MRKHKKSKRSNRNKTVTAYISAEKMAELQVELQHSEFQSISSLIRHKILKRKVVTKKWDNTIERLLMLMVNIFTILDLMSVKNNVIVEELNAQKWPIADQPDVDNTFRIFNEVSSKVSAIHELITKISYKWLPE